MLIQIATALATPTAAAAAPPSSIAPALPVQVAAASVPAPVASDSNEEIVVQGMRVNKQKVREFIRAVTEAPYEGQLGRFHAPACPVAMGLTDIQNLRVAARMTEARAGLSAAQVYVLTAVANGGEASVNELAAQTMTDRSSVASVILRKSAT